MMRTPSVPDVGGVDGRPALFPRPSETFGQRFDRDAWVAREAIAHYLDAHSADKDTQQCRREDAVAAMFDFLTDAEMAEGAAWALKRSAGWVAE